MPILYLKGCSIGVFEEACGPSYRQGCARPRGVEHWPTLERREARNITMEHMRAQALAFSLAKITCDMPVCSACILWLDVNHSAGHSGVAGSVEVTTGWATIAQVGQ